MSTARSRPLALLAVLGAVLFGAVQPVAAADPVQPPSVHAEMLEEHAGEPIGFTPGATPAPLSTDVPGGATASEGGVGGIAGLPNGLSHEVFGYLPYWTLSSGTVGYLDYDLVSTIAYFSVGAPRRNAGRQGRPPAGRGGTPPG